MARVRKISEGTLIPVGLAVLVIGGATGWVTKTTFQLSDHSERLARIEDNSEQIKSDVIRIKTLLGVKNEPRSEESADTWDGPSRVKGEDVQSLSRRIHELKTGDATDFGTEEHDGTAGDLEQG